MITKETCVKIWNCHDQIEKSQKLIQEMAEIVKKDKEKKAPDFHNAFGERAGLQLGVPSGDTAYRIFGVSIDMGVKIIEQHIKDNEKRLEELMAIAKIELAG